MTIILKSCFIPFILGFLTLSVLLKKIKLRYKILFLLGASLPTGFGICSLALFFSYLFNPIQAKSISIIITLIMTILLAQYLWPWVPSPYRFPVFFTKNLIDKHRLPNRLLHVASCILFLATLAAATHHFLLSTALNISGGWDARYAWTVKAEFMFRNPEEWRRMFSPQIFWTHPDYPLLLPTLLVWGWNGLGYESLVFGPIAALGFYISCALFLTWYLAERVSLISGWIGGAFFLAIGHYRFWATAQYADIPLAFFMTASGLIMVLSLQSQQKNLFFLSGLMAGFASWTKNEGLLFLLWIFLAFILVLYFKHRGKIKTLTKSAIGFMLGSSLPLLATILLKVFLGTTGEYLGPKRTAEDYLGLILGDFNRTRIIFEAFFAYMSSFELWKGLWEFSLAGALVLGLRKKTDQTRTTWFLFLIVILINLGNLLALQTTAYNIIYQIKTTFDRLLLHSGILAIAFSFEALTFTKSPKIPENNLKQEEKF
ncbi:MAG TPA: hypothetical protein PLO78_09725 [Candidatus Omnitrophota bacterium]|nr:hypothetical protein [Candidatus Omnitrophota bacterium]